MARVVRGPDGVIHRFPDDATDAEIATALKATLPAQSPARPAAAAPAQDSEAELALAAAMGGGFSPAQSAAMGQTAVDVSKGAAKGVANTAIGAGQLFNDYTPVGRINRGI